MPVMIRRLISLAIFTVQLTRPSNMRVSLHIHNVALMFKFDKTKRYEELERAIDAATKQTIQFKQEDGSYTKEIYWLTYSKLNKTRFLTMKINPDLYDFVLNIRQSAGFSIILLSDLLKLESQYALRWFEIIVSRSGHADKNNYFFVKYTIDEIKTIFAIGGEKYSRPWNFKKNIIDNPIAEINNKSLGYNIVPEYRYTGKSLSAVFLRCKIIKRTPGDESITELMRLNVHKYYICHQEAKKSLDIKNFKNQGSYQTALTRKTIELLIERVQNE
jgi:plasmid replication initiation protein